MNKITAFAGQLDKDMNVALYLLPTKEITKAQYDFIKENFGVYGPGRQVLDVNGTYYLKSDEASEAAIERLKAESKEKGLEFPA